MTANNPEVSVVIPAYNEATYIDRLLEALVLQNFKDFEVVVSDATSHDGTDKVVKQFSKKLDVRMLESPPKGPAHGRNVGAKTARGKWLLFLDADDDIDNPNFIETLLNETKKRGWKTSTAKYRVLKPTFMEWLGMGVVNYQYLKLLSHTTRPVAPGYCILTLRSLFESVDGFNEKIQFGEDYDYVTRTAGEGFGFISKTSYYIDMRRAKEQGGFRLFIKGIKNEVYRYRPGYSLEKNPVKYEFGKHSKRQK